MRVLYLTDSESVHDDRFRSVMSGRGWDVLSGLADGPGWWRVHGDRVPTGGLPALKPDVVQAGPLDVAAEAGVLADVLPLVVTCWGTDGFGPFSDAVRRCLAGAARVICDCTHIAGMLSAAGADPARITRFVWGIDLSRFTPPEHLPEPGLVVTTRALEPLYDHETVIRAFARAVRRNEDLRLRMYGLGSLRGELTSLSADLGVDDRVEIANPVPEEELADELRRATLWVNAARSDGTPISLMQALACGCAVAAADTPCVREAAGPASGVALFPVGDHAALADAIVAARRPSGIEWRATRDWLAAVADWSVNAELYLDAIASAGR